MFLQLLIREKFPHVSSGEWVGFILKYDTVFYFT
jgi:hypothetical protein